jgi:hypothetical protein
VAVKNSKAAADAGRMRWSLVVVAGLAGLLLGGPGGAVFTAVIADAAFRLAPTLRTRS